MNEPGTSFLDCKHKHMLKSGAPPHKVRSPVSSVSYRIPWFHKENGFLRVITLRLLVLSQFFQRRYGPFRHAISFILLCIFGEWLKFVVHI